MDDQLVVLWHDILHTFIHQVNPPLSEIDFGHFGAWRRAPTLFSL